MDRAAMEDAETFVIQAELAYNKVKALAQNRMSPQQFDELEFKRSEDARRRQQAKQRKAKQAFQRKVKGRQGKGIHKDFENFCKFCRLQYQLPTPKCLKCDHPTQTLQQRQDELSIMVDQYKKKKKKREQRKHKWEMWKKTQSMLWKKTNTHYTKWQMFVSDSEQQPEQQPIVPKDDPNFRAMQADMEQRKKLRIKGTQNAKRLKQKGNKAMKQGDPQKAMQLYTLALQHIKDMKSIYTNRALAYIKLKKYKKAIADCSNVIQYMEVFQKIGQNKDITFKAFSRRALARKQLKQYVQALKDAQQALKLFPQDKSAHMLKKQIEGFVEHTKQIQRLLRQKGKKQKPQQRIKQNEQENQQKQVQEESQFQNQNTLELDKDLVKQLAQAQLKQQSSKVEKPRQEQASKQLKQQETVKEIQKSITQNPIQKIPKILENLTELGQQALMNVLLKQKNNKTVFIASKGVTKCLQKFVSMDIQNEEDFSTVKSAHQLSLMICFCMSGDGVGEKQVWDFGVQKLHKKIAQCLVDETKLKIDRYSVMQDTFEILIQISLYEKYREMISKSKQTEQFLQKVYPSLITKSKKQTGIVNVFMIYFGNLCMGQNAGIKKTYLTNQKFKVIINSLFMQILRTHTKSRRYLDLKRNSYSLITNILTTQSFRQTFCKNEVAQYLRAKQNNQEGQTNIDILINQIRTYLFSNENFTQYMEGILSIFVNLTLGNSICLDQLIKVLFQRFVQHPQRYSKEIVYRSLLIISRLKYQNFENWRKWLKLFDKYAAEDQKNKQQGSRNHMVQIVKILNLLYQNNKAQGFQFSDKPSNSLLNYLIGYIDRSQSNQILYCNTCNLFSIWIEASSIIPWKQEAYQLIKPKIKQLVYMTKEKTGNWRKNSALLLAKSANNEECKIQFNKQHGMQVLKSIAHLIV